MTEHLAGSALKLIQELESYKGKLPPFQENELRKALEEILTLFEQNCEAVASNEGNKPEVVAGIHLRHATLERNKQCILAYLYNRLKIIRDMRWEHGPVLPSDIRSNMAEQEVVFFARYSKLLGSYMASLGEGHGVDLTQDLKPPKSLMVEVLTLEDYGEFLLDDGTTVLLKKAAVHCLPLAQCEHLIKQNIVQIVKQDKAPY